MSTIAAAVYDAIAALPGRVCSIHDVVKALPDIDWGSGHKRRAQVE
jgi:hypothetical protein